MSFESSTAYADASSARHDVAHPDPAPGTTEHEQRTRPFSPTSGSALDPLAQEVTWIARELTTADPTDVDTSVLQAITGGFDHLLEVAWKPGRAAVISEVAVVPANTESGVKVRCRLAVGMFGPPGTTAAEIAGLRPLLDDLVD